MKPSLSLGFALSTSIAVLAQTSLPATPSQARVASVNSQPRVDVSNIPRPIDISGSAWIEDLTMMEVRDLIKSVKAGKFVINGVSLTPVEKTIENSMRMVAFRPEATVAAITKSMGK